MSTKADTSRMLLNVFSLNMVTENYQVPFTRGLESVRSQREKVSSALRFSSPDDAHL